MLRNIKIKENYGEILIFLYTLSMIIDAKFTTIVPTLVFGTFCIYKIIKKGEIKLSFYEMGLVVFIISILISFIKAPYPIQPGTKILMRIVRFLFIPLFLGQFSLDEKHKRFAVYGGSVGIIYWFAIFVNKISKNIERIGKSLNLPLKEVLRTDNFWKIRYELIGDSISYAGVVLASLVIIGVCILLRETELKIKEKIGLYILNLMSFIMLLSTQSRAGFLSLAISVIIIFVITKHKKILFITMLIGIGISSVFFKFLNNSYIKRYKFKDTSTLARIEVYKEAFRIFKENPLKGVGFENFKQAQNKAIFRYHREYFHPHNMPLKALSETGIIGFLAYYFWIILLLVKMFLKRNETSYLIGFSVLLNMAIFENFEMVLSTTKGLPIIIMIVGICINSSYYNYDVRNKE